MKRLINFLLVLVLTFTAVSLVACDNGGNGETENTTGFTYELKTDDEGEKYLSIEGFTVSDEVAKLMANNNFAAIEDDRNLVIPAEATLFDEEDAVKYPVKEIEPSAFANQLFITGLTIPATVETVGSACLAGCTNLESLTVNFIGKKAEGNVNDEKTLAYLFGTTAATGATSSVVSYNASGTKTYYLPDSLKTLTVTGDVVGDYAVNGFTSLEMVILSGNVTKIGSYAFKNCTSLINYQLGGTIVTLGAGAFSGCSALVEVGLAGATALKTIGDYAFDGCTSLGYSVNTVTFAIPANVTTIGAHAFCGCASIKKIDLSANASLALGTCAFEGCTSLTNVALSNAIVYGSNVFTGCEELKKSGVTGYDFANPQYVFDFEY